MHLVKPDRGNMPFVSQHVRRMANIKVIFIKDNFLSENETVI